MEALEPRGAFRMCSAEFCHFRDDPVWLVCLKGERASARVLRESNVNVGNSGGGGGEDEMRLPKVL